jgi:hypothetical protein
MTMEEREILRSYADKHLRIITTDDEEMVVKLILMQDQYEDFICDIISTNRVAKYRMPLQSSAYVIPYNVVASFALVPEKD